MLSLFDNDILVCRPALQKDTDEMLELCSHIWEGGDYIPHVWQDWLADPDGLLGVAEMGGRVVGIFKLTKFQEQEWYMEGLRVHPDVQGRGVAAHIHNFVMDTWHRMGSGVIRLVTGSYNEKVHQMCTRSGFTRIGEFIPQRAPSLPEDTHAFAALSMEDAPRAMQIVLASPAHALSWGLINLGWVYADPQLKHIHETILKGHAWWWRDGAGFLSIWEDDDDDERNPHIQLVACDVSSLPDLLLDYRRLAHHLGYQSSGWVAPNQPEVLAALDKAGFSRSWDISLYIFELHSPPA